MPDRYWVGGTANWDGTAGTKWSATSGGAGGATVPTAADDVFFNAASGASTVTIASNVVARSINCTGFTGTITGTSNITVSGSITLVAAMAWTHTGLVTIVATGTLTTAGKQFSSTTINGAGITVTLGGPLDLAGRNLTVSQGTFTTNGNSITAGTLISQTTSVRTINLGASTLTLSNGILFTVPDNLTFNAGTSTINITGSSTVLDGGGRTFNNVTINATSCGVDGSNTIANLTVVAPATAGFSFISFAANALHTITALATSGTAGNRRVWLRSSTYGISTRLVVNSASGLSDLDFRDIIVSGTAAPISGTRIGDLRGNSGITFSAPKTVFRMGTGDWTDDRWAATSGGAVSTNNFPLAQDTAVFNESTSTGTHTMTSAIPYCGTVDMSARTSALTLQFGAAFTVYGNWIYGSGVTPSGAQTLTFSGRNTQTITSVGKGFGGSSIVIDSYGGTVELADAFNDGSSNIIVTNGTFNTRGFSVTASTLSSSNSNVRSILLGSSTVTLSGASSVGFGTSTNLRFDAGTSTIVCTSGGINFTGGGLTYNNVSFTPTIAGAHTLSGTNTFASLTVDIPLAFTAINSFTTNANQTVTGALTVSGSSSTRRFFISSLTLGAPITLTVGTLVAPDCDFRDITIAGTAAGTSPTRAGNCGGNSGITFPAPKTVFRIATGNWSDNQWATTSGGAPSADNFPLAQDTAVFDNAGGSGTVTIDRDWNIGSINASSRTTAMTISMGGSNPFMYGSWTSGTGLTNSGSGTLNFAGRGTSSITSNGVAFAFNLSVSCVTGTVQLTDALTVTAANGIVLVSGTFDAITYNVTTPVFNSSATAGVRTLRMGSGTWTLTGAGSTWNVSSVNLSLIKGTANIVLSDNTTTTREFLGGNFAYNKLTIGGATSTSTTSIQFNNSFTELASTKTVAHTIALVSAQQFGAWTVTGTAGNVVTLAGSTIHTIAGAATSGIDYLAMGSIGFAAQSPGEFYAGVNSTGTAAAPVFRTPAPAARTLYWVGGTGNWSDTARWSTTSNGTGGAAVPTSLDNVIFNSGSSATAYTATIDVVARCNQLTITGPASGNLTLAGTGAVALILHGNTSFPATGFTRTFTTGFILSGSTTGKTFTSNGVVFSSSLVVNGMGAGWSLSDALNLGTGVAPILTMSNGTFSTNNFGLTAGALQTGIVSNSATMNLGSSTVTVSGSTDFISFIAPSDRFTFNAGTSQINVTLATGTPSLYNSSNVTFHNMTLTPVLGTLGVRFRIGSTNTFNNLTFGAPVNTRLFEITMETSNPLTVSGTLTFTAPAAPTSRHFCVQAFASAGTPYTISCGAFSGTDVDFRDITITGAAAPVSGTRLGDGRGNSGITFPAGKTVYWNLAAGGNWSATAWATTSGGTPAVNNFPLAQDTCIIEATGLNSGATVTLDAAWLIGTINMSARTTNTMTLSVGFTTIVHGNWINGTGVTLSGGGQIQFAGRTSQTITCAGRSFPQVLSIGSPDGTLTLQDALTTTGLLALGAGTLSTNNFAVNVSSFNASGSSTRSLVMGSSTMTISGASTSWNIGTATNLTLTGTGTISMTSTGAGSAKTFAGGSVAYTDITLNQGGSGNLTITGNNRFRDITATQTASSAASILLGTTTQTLSRFTGKGETGRLLTIQGTSALTPCALVLDRTGPATNSAVDFLNLIGVRAYLLTDTWYAGNNSTNGGTLGWIFSPTSAALADNGSFLLMLF